VINWQSFAIDANSAVNFVQPSSSQAVLNNVTVSGDIITGTLTSNGGGNIMLSNTDAIVGTGTTGVSVTSMTGTMAGNYSLSGGTLTLSGSAGAMISPVVLVNAGTTTSGGATFASETTGTGP
jgi:filamentous hemagglutinin family protein